MVTQLAACFDESLSFIRSAFESLSSKACYLHGSFGVGKSHFMAVLDLLLAANLLARAVTELAFLCEEHRWLPVQNSLRLIVSDDCGAFLLASLVPRIFS